MKNIIVNADDFGINEVVTSEIERLIEKGCVTSTTIMANGTCLDEVKRFAASHPEVSFGVHLCLSEFASITKSEGLRKAGLTDENGVFIKKAIFSLKNLEDRSVQKAIKDELCAQIEIIKALGFTISHADSHHHIHTLYPLHTVIEEVLRSNGIKRIRLCVGFNTLRSKAHVLNYIRHIKLNRYYKSHFITADGFYGFQSFVSERVPLRDGQVIELMCHPGHPSERYKREMLLVESNRLSFQDTQFVSYLNL